MNVAEPKSNWRPWLKRLYETKGKWTHLKKTDEGKDDTQWWRQANWLWPYLFLHDLKKKKKKIHVGCVVCQWQFTG